MKKDVNLARSKRDGIVFYSTVCPYICTEAFRDDDGNIQTKLLPSKLSMYMDYAGTIKEQENGNAHTRQILLVIFNLILLFSATLHAVISLETNFLIAAIFFCIFVSRELFDFIELSYRMKSRKGSERSTARYHAAEHMVLNAYEKLQRIPTLDEVQQFSRFSRTCGSRTTIYKIFMHIVLCLNIVCFTYDDVKLYFAFLWGSIAFTILAERLGFLTVFQVFFTSPPSDSELEVAIEGLRQFESMEERLESSDEFTLVVELPADGSIPPYIF